MPTRARGTEDVLPAAAGRWTRLERIARELAARHGFGEVRTPIFEHTELVHRVGASTDVVQKETYDFSDRGGRSLTLRPEGTAPVVRACLQGRLLDQGLPVKLCYVTLAAFRYERPEAGRLRQHHQFGCETFGAPGPVADAELAVLLGEFLEAAGIRGAVAHVNSIGCAACRPGYREALRDYYRPRLSGLCGDCQRRFEQNPLRLLDCRVDRDAALGAPHAVDHLDPDCAAHHAALLRLLGAAGVPARQDHLLVRGFDYYTRTVFEFVQGGESEGAVSLGGGGRYDDLVAELGGPRMPAAGFGVGMERLLLALDRQGEASADARSCDVLVAGEPEAAFALCATLRRGGLAAEFDPLGRSLKAQLRYADRLQARFVAILGPGGVTLRDMAQHAQREVAAEAVAAEVAAVIRR